MMKLLLPIGILLVAFVATLFVARTEPNEVEEDVEQPRRVEVMRAELVEVRARVASQGFLEARTISRLSSEVSGKVIVTSEDFYPGNLVREGDLLVEIDPSNYETVLKRAAAQLARNEVVLAEERARVEQARIDWERSGNTEASALTLRQPQLFEAEANVAAARAELAEAERNVERTRIYAPFDALVRTRQVAKGQFLPVGGLVGELLAIDFAEVRLPIVSKDLPFVSLPSPMPGIGDYPKVWITAQDGGDPVKRQAEVIRTENVIDRDSRVLFAVARLKDPYAWLYGGGHEPIRIGSFVTAELESVPIEAVFKVPTSAIRGVDEVAVINEENRISFSKLQVLLADGDFVYARDGLEEGDLICLTSPQSLYSGTLVSWEADTE
ncbi:MAG: efflux RND transporter periplasmic adaptor subunit [Opitutales bacterium]|nr:efflux RND transporter periplasmic adaptor subunit [Opitutales bacterium]